jgi:hypothetical protein
LQLGKIIEIVVEYIVLMKNRLVGNPKKHRKEFSCFRCSKVVDSDLCNFKDLIEEIIDQYPHGYNEVVHFFTMMVSRKPSQKSQQIRTYLKCLENMFMAR